MFRDSIKHWDICLLYIVLSCSSGLMMGPQFYILNDELDLKSRVSLLSLFNTIIFVPYLLRPVFGALSEVQIIGLSVVSAPFFWITVAGSFYMGFICLVCYFSFNLYSMIILSICNALCTTMLSASLDAITVWRTKLVSNRDVSTTPANLQSLAYACRTFGTICSLCFSSLMSWALGRDFVMLGLATNNRSLMFFGVIPVLALLAISGSTLFLHLKHQRLNNPSVDKESIAQTCRPMSAENLSEIAAVRFSFSDVGDTKKKVKEMKANLPRNEHSPKLVRISDSSEGSILHESMNKDCDEILLLESTPSAVNKSGTSSFISTRLLLGATLLMVQAAAPSSSVAVSSYMFAFIQLKPYVLSLTLVASSLGGLIASRLLSTALTRYSWKVCVLVTGVVSAISGLSVLCVVVDSWMYSFIENTVGINAFILLDDFIMGIASTAAFIPMMTLAAELAIVHQQISSGRSKDEGIEVDLDDVNVNSSFTAHSTNDSKEKEDNQVHSLEEALIDSTTSSHFSSCHQNDKLNNKSSVGEEKKSMLTSTTINQTTVSNNNNNKLGGRAVLFGCLISVYSLGGILSGLLSAGLSDLLGLGSNTSFVNLKWMVIICSLCRLLPLCVIFFMHNDDEAKNSTPTALREDFDDA